MAITIEETVVKKKTAKKKSKTKAKPQKKSKKKSKISAHAETLDQMGILNGEIVQAKKALKLFQDQYDELYGEFVEEYDEDVAVDAGTVEMCEAFRATVGKHGKKTTVTDNNSVRKLLNKVKKGLASELMKFGITDLNKYLTPDDLEGLIEEEHVNKRSIKFEEL